MRLRNAEHENLQGEGEKSHLLRVPGQGVWTCYTGTYGHRPSIIGDPRHVGLNIFQNLPVPRQGTTWWGNLENPPWTEGASTPAPPHALQDWGQVAGAPGLFSREAGN